MNSSQLPNQPTISEQSSKPIVDLSDSTSTVGETNDTLRVPVIAETINVGKRIVETGQVRLVKTVHEDRQDVDIPLAKEYIDVERVPIGRLVDDAPATRQEGDTTIYPVLQEEYVVVRRLRLVEEIRVTKRQEQLTERQTISLRREKVAVERIAVDTSNGRFASPGEPTLGEASL